MEVSFRTDKLARTLNSVRTSQMVYGPSVARVINRRLLELQALANLHDATRVPQLDCHQLKGKRVGQFAVRLPGGFRLVFVPASMQLKSDGGIDLSSVTAITILEVVNYHD